MFVLIWATLLFSVTNSNANSDVSVWGRQTCQSSQYCITLTDGEIKAEAGLCVVIPCSFTVPHDFTPKNLVWFKCEPPERRCGDSDIIFHTNNEQKVQSKFRGRVSLLEPDVGLKNCSIIINDLRETDSGSYQFRVNGPDNGFTFLSRATVSIKGLSQKPTVMIPPLTAGQQSTLTCTAPGLCSGSDPKITWMWSRAGEKDSRITENITDFKTENVTAVTQRHSSTLTFNSSAEHHSTNVTCKVSFRGNMTTEETVTLSVTYVKVKITGNISVKEGETLNLTCSVESFPPSFIKWMKFSEQNIQNGTEINVWNDTETYLQEESGMATLSISNVTAEDSGQYICTAKHLNNTLEESVDVTVIYMREAVITGNTTVQKGDVLNLTCSVESFPPSLITWTKLGFNTKLHNGTELKNDTGSATLIISDVTAEHSGQYICTAKHLDTTVRVRADVTVTWFSEILNNSGCELQSEVLTCVCISEGFPLPTIKWPLLKTQAEYSVITTVSNYTVNSTFILTANDHHNSSVECVSSNENGEAKENLTTRTNLSEQDDQYKKVLKLATRLETIVAFLIGVLLSTIICCLANKFHRKKQKSSGNLDETLEMVASQEDPLIYDGQVVEDDQTQDAEAPEDGTVAAEKTAPELDSELKDVEYASIDFSLLKRKSPRVAAEKQETEYAEIKKEVKEENEDDGGQKGEVLESKEEAIIEEDEETQRCVTEEEEGEDMAVYSNVRDIMDEMLTSVSLLEPALNQSNCSVIIKCFNESDSGSYEIRVFFTKDEKDSCTSTSRANITVTGINITDALGRTSNLTFNLSVEQHGTEVIYTFSFTDNNTTEEIVTLNVTCSNNLECLDQILDQLTQIVRDPKAIIAFLFGMLLSATICCLARICCRKKQRKSEKLAENLEMVTTQAAPLIDGGQPMEDNDGSHDREAAVGGPEAAGQSAPSGDMEPKEVEYSDIDFSVLKTKGPTEAEETQEPTETEYAEIKKETPEEGQDGGGEEGEVLEDAMIGENRVTEECMPAKEEEGEDVALYSNMDEIMDQT
ncbi:sialic acid-binding Ig-like lectin 11 [Toxotes jaculatrix]|uniref:sialic acid-binding Ig-like lectin 11 n=1 Tax=Toxotes jaculatrix TaxID=941984 RepID=UPI001B3AF8E8|nr:sialic acid-binding Ig-like lectin 11 [Toxotes jaculatrix]